LAVGIVDGRTTLVIGVGKTVDVATGVKGGVGVGVVPVLAEQPLRGKLAAAINNKQNIPVLNYRMLDFILPSR
jgi:hypothetical protein